MDKKQILYRTFLRKEYGVTVDPDTTIRLRQYEPHMYWMDGEADIYLEGLVDFLIEEL